MRSTPVNFLRTWKKRGGGERDEEGVEAVANGGGRGRAVDELPEMKLAAGEKIKNAALVFQLSPDAFNIIFFLFLIITLNCFIFNFIPNVFKYFNFKFSNSPSQPSNFFKAPVWFSKCKTFY